MPDFIPDSQFVPDPPKEGSAALSGVPVPAAAAGAPDFVPDAEFTSDSEKYGTAGQQVLTGLEGAARGATLGVSDLVEEAALHNAAERQGRAEENPGISNVAQFGGALAPIVATGGGAAPEEFAAAAAAKGAAAPVEGAVAAASRLTPAYLAARAGKAVTAAAGGEGLAARAIGMGAEGALFGAGNAATDASLGDPHLTAQKVLSDVGMGAAFGSGLGVLSKGLEAALPAATKKLTGALSDLKESVLGTADEPTASANLLSSVGSAVTGDTPTSWSDAFYAGLNQVDRPRTVRDLAKNLQSVYDAGDEAASDLYETAAPENIKQSLDEMPAAQAHSIAEDVVSKILLQTDEATPELELQSRLGPATAKVVDQRMAKLADDLLSSKTAYEVHTSLSDFARDLDRGKLIKFDTLPTASQMADQEVLRGIRDTIRGSLKDENLWGPAAQHYAQTSDEYSAYRAARTNFEKSFMAKEPATKGYYIDPRKVETFFNRYGDVGQDVRKAYLDEFLNRTSSLAKASENYHGFKAAEGSLSDRVSELAKKHEELTGIADSLRASRGESLSPGGRLGELGAGYVAHAAGIPHPVIGAVLGAVEAYKAIKNPYELGSTLSGAFSRLKVLGDLAESTGKRITSLSKQIFAVPAARTLPVSSFAVASTDGYDKKVKRIDELANNPQKLSEHLEKTTKELYQPAPNVSEGIQSAMVSGVQFLNSKIPRPVDEMVLSPEWKPSRAQKEQFLNYYNIVDDPTSVLKQVRHGLLTNESMEALQTVYPKLLDEMRSSVMENLNQKKARELPYAAKISLSKFLGQPLDEAMTPRVLASNQAALSGASAQPTPQPAPAPTKAKSTLGGLKELDVSSRVSTRSRGERDNET